MNRASVVNIIISGGGTGGHVFPAIAIADAIRQKVPGAEILFVGAMGRMEMDLVPKAGYRIEGLWISGFQRSLSVKNLLFPLKLAHSLLRARSILQRFRPDVAIGVGGFASGPLLEMAVRMGIPAVIQEQNSYAGATNRILARKVQKICVAYPDMGRYFPADKLVLTGNPVRGTLFAQKISKEEAAAHFGLDPSRPIVLLFGGSLGALTLNTAMEEATQILRNNPAVQVIWQCGKTHHDRFSTCQAAQLPQVVVRPFLDRMDMAYAAADVVVCRAGALTISELALAGKAAILVPSPHVAEDHQRKNAQALVDKHAAILVLDADAGKNLWPEILHLLADANVRSVLEQRIKSLGKPNAAADIASVALGLAQYKP